MQETDICPYAEDDTEYEISNGEICLLESGNGVTAYCLGRDHWSCPLNRKEVPCNASS